MEIPPWENPPQGCGAESSPSDLLKLARAFQKEYAKHFEPNTQLKTPPRAVGKVCHDSIAAHYLLGKIGHVPRSNTGGLASMVDIALEECIKNPEEFGNMVLNHRHGGGCLVSFSDRGSLVEYNFKNGSGGNIIEDGIGKGGPRKISVQLPTMVEQDIENSSAKILNPTKTDPDEQLVPVRLADYKPEFLFNSPSNCSNSPVKSSKDIEHEATAIIGANAASSNFPPPVKLVASVKSPTTLEQDAEDWEAKNPNPARKDLDGGLIPSGLDDDYKGRFLFHLPTSCRNSPVKFSKDIENRATAIIDRDFLRSELLPVFKLKASSAQEIGKESLIDQPELKVFDFGFEEAEIPVRPKEPTFPEVELAAQTHHDVSDVDEVVHGVKSVMRNKLTRMQDENSGTEKHSIGQEHSHMVCMSGGINLVDDEKLLPQSEDFRFISSPGPSNKRFLRTKGKIPLDEIGKLHHPQKGLVSFNSRVKGDESIDDFDRNESSISMIVPSTPPTPTPRPHRLRLLTNKDPCVTAQRSIKGDEGSDIGGISALAMVTPKPYVEDKLLLKPDICPDKNGSNTVHQTPKSASFAPRRSITVANFSRLTNSEKKSFNRGDDCSDGIGGRSIQMKYCQTIPEGLETAEAPKPIVDSATISEGMTLQPASVLGQESARKSGTSPSSSCPPLEGSARQDEITCMSRSVSPNKRSRFFAAVGRGLRGLGFPPRDDQDDSYCALGDIKSITK
jgi:hypothetical protein